MESLAQSAMLAVMARLINVIGVPCGLALMFWLFHTVNTVQVEMAKLPEQFRSIQYQFEAMNRRQDEQNIRLQRLEEPFFRRSAQ